VHRDARKHRYRQAFIKSPVLKFRLVGVSRISDGIAILEALGEGTLLVSTRRRPPDGYYSIAEVGVTELVGWTEAEVLAILDSRTDAMLARERERISKKF
jgi:hypothetical protein